METEILLFILALAAGLVDAIAGGGGLITLPALLWAGLGPLEALATNTAQGVFGTAAASAKFLRRGLIDLHRAALAFSCAFVGAASGVLFIRQIGADLPAWLI
ncbi:MAG: TSUP family transporter, partial [Chromatiaceae bacterium]